MRKISLIDFIYNDIGNEILSFTLNSTSILSSQEPIELYLEMATTNSLTKLTTNHAENNSFVYGFTSLFLSMRSVINYVRYFLQNTR
jgi:hypothetical protein